MLIHTVDKVIAAFDTGVSRGDVELIAKATTTLKKVLTHIKAEPSVRTPELDAKIAQSKESAERARLFLDQEEGRLKQEMDRCEALAEQEAAYATTEYHGNQG